MYLPIMVQPIVAQKADIPTSQFASTPESMAGKQAAGVPTLW
jgi:hypothetical protein